MDKPLMLPDDPALTMEEAARYLRIGRSTLYERVLPSLPVVKIGRRRTVRLSVVEAWRRAHEEPAQVVSGGR